MSKEERAKLQDPKLDQRARFGLIIKAIEEKPEREKARGKQIFAHRLQDAGFVVCQHQSDKLWFRRL